MAATPRTAAEAFVEAHVERFERELVELLRIPSVSTSSDPVHRQAMGAAASWLGETLARLGCEVELVAAGDSGGNPILLARRRSSPDDPTVLVYGHYDVQPADPADGWQTPAFEPCRRLGRLYGRGTTDDKGQLHMHLKALETLLATADTLPLSTIFLFEGEEEIGSPSLARFVEERAADLRCAAILISDSEMWDRDTPALEVGFRGIAAAELTVCGPRSDLHSGLYGGAVQNPATVLCRLVAGLQNGEGRITLPGFYDDVRPAPTAERSSLRALPFDEAAFLAAAGAGCPGGEAGFTTLERIGYRPSFDVHGLTGGYSGSGGKTIIPATASAKLSFRLVPDQDPDGVMRALADHLRAQLPAGMTLELAPLGTARPWTTDPGRPLFDAARRALRRVFRNNAVLLRGGGSLPIVPLFEQALGAPVLLLGFGLPGSNAHGPDEWLDLDVYRRGIVALVELYGELAAALRRVA
jgi:acetylornithine deacetylase/succinyl-diaminopimelate desuccinylase-like protein